MAETFNSLRVEVKITGMLKGDDGSEQPITITYERNMSNGTGTDGVGNCFWDKTRALAGTTEDIDLGTGGVNDFQGADAVLGDIKVLYYENLSTTTTEVLKFTEGSATKATTLLDGTAPKVKIGPSGIMLLINPIDGYALTDGSADFIGSETTATSNYQLFVAGKNA